MKTEIKSKAESLVAEIIAMAEYAKLNAEDSSAGPELQREAEKIEEAGNENSAIIEFHKYAAHWKGLRDIYFAGGKQKLWNQKVKNIKQLCEDVMLERGLLKPTLLRKFKLLLKR